MNVDDEIEQQEEIERLMYPKNPYRKSMRESMPKFRMPDFSQEGHVLYRTQSGWIIIYTSSKGYTVDGIYMFPLEKESTIPDISIPGRLCMAWMIHGEEKWKKLVQSLHTLKKIILRPFTPNK